MICPKCNAILEDGAKFCHTCGANVESVATAPVVEAPVAETPIVETPVVETPVVETPVVETPVIPTPVAPTPVQPPVKVVEKKVIPDEYQPLGAWAYFGLSMLFSVPVVGLVFLIIFSFSRGNINRRNFARSFWCPWLIIGILAVLFFILLLIVGILGGISMRELTSSGMSYM